MKSKIVCPVEKIYPIAMRDILSRIIIISPEAIKQTFETASFEEQIKNPFPT